MTVLLKQAILPNLVQTIENNPAFVHGGPFANIAHGCNSVIATKAALKLSDYVVTEAGFGADLGAEKFFNIKCRKAGLTPDAAVIVATVRALKMNGGVAKKDLDRPDVAAVLAGCANLGRHIENVRKFGVPVIVAINHFTSDTAEETTAVKGYVEALGSKAIVCTHWADGSKGALALAEAVVAITEEAPAPFKLLYGDELTLIEKINVVAKEVYRADSVIIDRKVRERLARWQDGGYGHLPVCMAKTQYSFSTDPELLGAPEGFVVPVREVRLSAGAGFIVAICGEIMTMPGLPRHPAALSIHLNDKGEIEGLF